MTDDKLILFKTVDDLRSYARVNGSDKGKIDKLVSRWKELQKEKQEPLEIKSESSNGMIDVDNIDTKDEL